MSQKGKVAIVRTSPRTIFADYYRLMNLAEYQNYLPKDVETALKINISWHFFYPGSSTTPWQLEGVIRTLLHRGLVQEIGRMETAGRPMLFGTTPDFLNYFAISSLEDLPPLEDEDMDALTERIEMMGEETPT